MFQCCPLVVKMAHSERITLRVKTSYYANKISQTAFQEILLSAIKERHRVEISLGKPESDHWNQFLPMGLLLSL